MRLIQEFIHSQHHPESSPHNITNLPPFYEKITIHTSAVTTFHTFSDPSGVGGMKCECIHAVGHWWKGLGCYDMLFINTHHDNVDLIHLHGGSWPWGGSCAPFLFIHSWWSEISMHWVSCTTDTLSDITGMHVVEPDCLPDGRPVTVVVHLNTVFRVVHLLPIFSKHQHHEQTLDLFSEFYINRYIDYHAFEVVVW